MKDNETREIKRCYGNVENQIDEILATIDTIDRNEIKARLKNAALDIKKIGYCLYGWDDEKTKIIQYDEELEEMFRSVDSNLVNAYWCFIEDDKLTDNDSWMFSEKCVALAIYNMLVDEEECVSNYANMLYGTVIELRHIGAMWYRLLKIKNIVETEEDTLYELGINVLEILSKLHQATSKLQDFLFKLVPQNKQ